MPISAKYEVFLQNNIDFLPITAYNDNMKYLSVSETAKKWQMSQRSVRNYCALGKIQGAFLTGKTWNIPENACAPERVNKKKFSDNPLLNALKEQKDMNLRGGIYHRTQIDLTYNSNHIEGSRLTEQQTRFIFETNTLGITDGNVNVDDIIETSNHFKCIDIIIDGAKSKLTERLVKELHFVLKTGISDSRKDWFRVGEYKKLPNEVGGNATCPPNEVAAKMKELLERYNSKQKIGLEDIAEFHQKFESIHPFQDGNGRVGRLVMFKECLRHNVTPFIIGEELKLYYYRGLKEWNNERGYLLDTCLAAQDKYAEILKYFKIDM